MKYIFIFSALHVLLGSTESWASGAMKRELSTDSFEIQYFADKRTGDIPLGGDYFQSSGTATIIGVSRSDLDSKNDDINESHSRELFHKDKKSSSEVHDLCASRGISGGTTIRGVVVLKYTKKDSTLNGLGIWWPDDWRPVNETHYSDNFFAGTCPIN